MSTCGLQVRKTGGSVLCMQYGSGFHISTVKCGADTRPSAPIATDFVVFRIQEFNQPALLGSSSAAGVVTLKFRRSWRRDAFII
jgi:hypothetical protein